MKAETQYIRWFETLSALDVSLVGGKNASLGEMFRALKHQGIKVPDGFATTTEAYKKFVEANELNDKIQLLLEKFKSGEKSLEQTGKAIRRLFSRAQFPEEIALAIENAYRELSRRYHTEEVDVAVRSSATAEDLPDASFAGQQETFLNISGIPEVLEACRNCFASLFTERALAYREEKGFDHLQVSLCVGIQKMVRSDKAGAGVMFSIDPETGFPDVVIISAAWGLGENVVQGIVTPDQYTVFKPLLRAGLKPIIDKRLGSKAKKLIYASEGGKTTRNVDTSGKERRAWVLKDEEILQLANWACLIEKHYGKPMDIEWAKDGMTGDLFIVQARPETVQSKKVATTLKTYKLKQEGKRLVSGLSIGEAIATGKVCRIISTRDIDKVEDGCILVTEMTDPDWVPIMKRVAGIVTDYGGRTCHAAIVSRELGIPAIVGTGDATQVLKNNSYVTLSCAEGERGFIYEGKLEYEVSEVNLNDIPETKTRLMMNIASPSAAFQWWRLPSQGIGLARMEFIINNIIKIHPMALVRFDELEDKNARKQIQEVTQGYEDKTEYFVEKLALGIGKITASQYPHPVIVRMSDFKTNEYADLIGGKQFEPQEANPMLGFRGASRYYSDRYREGFALECRAIKKVREEMGFENLLIMIPFCRTLEEADRVLEVLAENGLKRGENGLQVYVMCEIPANVELAEEFCDRFDGFSIGSNDLTQLTLGVDRDSAELAHLFDERNLAVKRMILRLIKTAHEKGRKVGICGQAPSDYPEFAEFLVAAGIDSISLNPDSIITVKKRVAEFEAKLQKGV
ncbi:MAG: phosphoenolpyruvate synthase [Oscillatoriaceae bacterium SKW80]|nr:phosphoenolpyruvate synthase [Oscillatoriaceae bacterium SKYG93]MCX8119324.1 phosphoenolpyruvate synthase [Oscillatoriaceae bacterium SKW80]MDW8454791.1 phosphoenolpyruvate synthase [Oscillatoriaceae cyanobacterium SKYGB_i_bin93]HIK28428.1 phosphoenolpyruvate synthase [Oscillatoriaceae cyanobacterium M7585_C2015_266]